MLSDEDLCRRIKTGEDSITEFKTESTCNGSELRKTLSAFANSVPEGSIAVLFAGIGNQGTSEGVQHSDDLQKTVQKACDQGCYPPIRHTTRAFMFEGKVVLAIMISASDSRPHFSGPAYVRTGTQSINATSEIYEDLISSRNEKARKILKWKDREIYFEAPITPSAAMFLKPGSTIVIPANNRGVFQCLVKACDPFCVQLGSLHGGGVFSFALEKVTITWEYHSQKLILSYSE